MDKQKVILLILDGWGYRKDTDHNAVSAANPVNFKSLMQDNKWTLIDASEERVGLPSGQMGNSEVGHTNIGAGRIVYQDLLRISNDIKAGGAKNNPVIKKLMEDTKNGSGRLHLLGLISDGGVHSHIEHFKGICLIAKEYGIKEVYIHAFTDGRDTPPNSGLGYITDLDNFLKENNAGKIADITGRFYAMDRDKRWDRVEKAWNLLRNGIGESEAETPVDAMKAGTETDEFVKPVKITGVDGTLKDGDNVFMMNFRADRVREIVSIMIQDNFDGFDRGKKPKLNVVTMTEYEKSFGLPIAYPPEDLVNILGEIISNSGLKQLRIAETEKYAHVTYFFNGGREEPFKNEERALIASPRDVATYDLKPQMSVYEVESKFEELFRKGDIDVVIMNFANPDMVGHTGVEEAAVNACKAVDECLGKVMQTARDMNAVLFVTADHGNSEQMWDYENNQPHTAHTLNPVVFAVYNYKGNLNGTHGKLADIAPTILQVLNIAQPKEMTGESLLA
ncbi:MAG: 2,3-bisphosphoglycerate-independent phosphoglycerate mutase [Mucispirillum sp.]|nr:2,3-bisphosphoglycerate-independent phosphoglycerate mutase [Mucispirillum sp.]